MTETEKVYFSKRCCSTCQHHCKSAKLDEARKFGEGPKPPWVCGNENCKTFDRPTKEDSHKTCEYWEMRDVSKWRSSYLKLRSTRDPKTGRVKYRHLNFLAQEVSDFCDQEMTHKYTNEPMVLKDRISEASRVYGISKEDVEYCIKYCEKE